jgi:hypothetical protein
MSTISEQQRQELQAHAGEPIEVVDDETKQLYYLVSADDFKKVRALLVEVDFEPREMYPLIAKTAGEAGWNDPEMDVYDHYDEHHKQD